MSSQDILNWAVATMYWLVPFNTTWSLGQIADEAELRICPSIRLDVALQALRANRSLTFSRTLG